MRRFGIGARFAEEQGKKYARLREMVCRGGDYGRNNGADAGGGNL